MLYILSHSTSFFMLINLFPQMNIAQKSTPLCTAIHGIELLISVATGFVASPLDLQYSSCITVKTTVETISLFSILITLTSELIFCIQPYSEVKLLHITLYLKYTYDFTLCYTGILNKIDTNSCISKKLYYGNDYFI